MNDSAARSTPLTVASFNVNGIRAAKKRGFDAWLAECSPDVLCLQEVRASDAILRSLLGEGWHVAHHESTIAGAKGRAGVAVATREPAVATRLEVGGSAWDGHGRWVEADLVVGGDVVTVISAYIHSGEADTPKQDDKYAFLDAVTQRLKELSASGGRVILTGDVNVGHTEADIKNWKGNIKRAGFLPQERAYLTRWFDELGFVDVVRAQAGEGPGPYSWWSWRGQAFDNDTGWRIDYHITSPEVAERVTSWRIDRAPSYAERISDHAPVVVTYAL